MDLPDINVWLAISLEDHPHHDRAVDYWKHERTAQLGFCRITMLGYVRLLCNKHLMAGKPMNTQEALDAYRSLMQKPSIAFCREPVKTDQILTELVHDNDLNPKIWTDTYIAAFAISSKLRVVSFDFDFNQFPKLDFLHLKM